jgi:hypothetical protein
VDDQTYEEARQHELLKIAGWESTAQRRDEVSDYAMAAVCPMEHDWSGALPEDEGTVDEQRARRLGQMDRWERETEAEVRAGVPGADGRLDTIRCVRRFEQTRWDSADLLDPEF